MHSFNSRPDVIVEDFQGLRLWAQVAQKAMALRASSPREFSARALPSAQASTRAWLDGEMAPRRGGEADKFGNRYEGIWTVRQLLEVLRGQAESLTVEKTGDDGKGAEFLLNRSLGRTEAHQVKRQRGSATAWSLRMLRDEGVLASARTHSSNGRGFHFVSLLPSPSLEELADKARRSDDLKHFVEGQLSNRKQRSDFDFLASEVWGSPETAFEVLRSVYARWPDERELRDTNAALAGMLLDGAPPLVAALALGDLISNNLGRTLNQAVVKERLAEYQLRFEPLSARPGLAERIASMSASWLGGTGAEMLDPPIPRDETREVAELLQTGERVVLVSGNAGEGKSAVLHQALSALGEAGWPVLALRLDRLEPFGSPLELGEQMGLPGSPVAALAAIAAEQPALLLIDQLDAVSLASGRMPASFGSILELLREASAFPNLRVLLAARSFDIANDHRLRRLAGEGGLARHLEIGRLTDEEVAETLERMGVAKEDLSTDQIEILGTPLHLVLLQVVTQGERAPGFSSSKDLFDLFWENKARTCRAHPSRPRFGEVISTLVDSMSSTQRLSVPTAVLDSKDLVADAGILASEHVLVRDGGQLAFFHESFFDYAFARCWILREESLLEFLLAGEQELFRRAQVRQVLAHMREEDGDRFLREVSELLGSSEVRFHIKEVILGLLHSLSDPGVSEWVLLEALLREEVTFEEAIWSALRSVPWFDLLYRHGELAAWIGGADDALRGRAVDVCTTAVRVRVDQVAELLGGLRNREDFPNLLFWMARFAPIQQSRVLFDLILDLVRKGAAEEFQNDIWTDAHGLGEAEAEWALELLNAFLVERPGAMTLSAKGEVLDLKSRDSSLLEIVSEAASRAPLRFCEVVLPYLLKVMAATKYEGDPPVGDRHFGFRSWQEDVHELDKALLYGLRKALVCVVSTEPDAARGFLEELAAHPYNAAQWLLYEGLGAGAETHADWAAEILLEGDHRLWSGYSDSAFWTTRELLERVGPRLSDEHFAKVEKMLLSFVADRDIKWRDYPSFTLLSAMPQERLSHSAQRRLGEMQRKFDQAEPPPPQGIRIRGVPPPIPQRAAEHMNDEQWLAAIAKYSTGERWNRIELVGDAEELARVLEAEAKLDAERFARLALRFTTDTHPAYANAIMRAVGDSEASIQPESVFRLLRHVDTLHRVENDGSLGDALRQLLDSAIPDDVIEIILERARHSIDPEEEGWAPKEDDGEDSSDRDPWSRGMNTVRGRAAETLGDLVIHDADGHRSALLGPYLLELAQDDSVAVRSSVAHLLGASLRYERPRALAAFSALIESDDRLLASRPVERLLIYVGRGDPCLIEPVVERMLGSEFKNVREAGGRLAAYAGLELERNDLIEIAIGSADSAIRKGAARVSAALATSNASGDAAVAALSKCFDDPEDSVREAAAEVAMELRGEDLGPFQGLLEALVGSAAFGAALPQLLITLEDTTSDVAELGLRCAERFLATHRDEMSNISSSAAADSRHVGELLLRTYAQSRSSAIRARTLDAIDELLLARAYGIDELVASAER